MGYRSKTTPEAVARAKLKDSAVQLRIAGASYQAIGNSLGVPRTTVHRWLQRYLEEAPKESSAELRTLALAKLDMITRVHAATIATASSARVMISAIELACRLGGLLRDPALNVNVGTDIAIYDFRADAPPPAIASEEGRQRIDIDSVLVPPPTLVNKPPELIAARAAGQQAKPEPATPKPARAPATLAPPEPRDSGSDYFVSSPVERDRVYSSGGSGFGGRPSTTEW